MERNLDTEAAIIINDLHSLRYRIEGLQAHPLYTDALNLVTQAQQHMQEGRADLHQREMKERFAKMDAAAQAPAAAPDWPPQVSAIGRPEGERRCGSTGQLFEARNGQWVRVNGDENEFFYNPHTGQVAGERP